MSALMRAAVFKGIGQLEIEKIEKPIIEQEDEIILEVEVCSICGTDVHILSVPPGYEATPGTVLGHELVGRVVEMGNGVKKVKVGDRVVVNPNDYCGTCDYCLSNLPNHCENIKAMGIHVNGGFADYVKITEKVAYKISDDVPVNVAAFAEPLACVLNGLKKIRVMPGEKVVVIGGGPIGLLFVQMMKASGAIVISSEHNEARRQYALKSGADFVVSPRDEDLEAFVKNKFPGGADVVIDVVGSQVAQALKLVKKAGKVLLFGVNTMAKPEVQQTDIVFGEVQMYGTWLANATFPDAIKVMESGVLNLAALVSHEFSLEEVLSGVDVLKQGEGIEVIINMKI
jgi:threonine dehydrogenase-like Zn-dependent dehydrogenase